MCTGMYNIYTKHYLHLQKCNLMKYYMYMDFEQIFKNNIIFSIITMIILYK